MTEQITLEQALELVDFDQDSDGYWYVKTVKVGCMTVEGDCGIVTGNCGTVGGDCDIIRGDCWTVKGDCNTVEGDCTTVQGRVLHTTNGRQRPSLKHPGKGW